MPTTEFELLYTTLRTTQDSRSLFPNLEWIQFERLMMLATVNAFRADRGLPLRTLTDIERAEQMASGHIDYTKKFALYCSELVTKDPSEVRP
jgi:hypothetical protein